MTIAINLARSGDADAIAAASRRYIEAGLAPSWTACRVAKCIAHPEWTVLVARDTGRFAGFAIMEFLDVHAHLALLAVAPRYRGCGTGRALVEWLESSARTAGTFTIRLELRAGNEAAFAFYGRLGYRLTGRRRRYYAGREDALMMERDLRVAQLGDAEPRP